VRSLSPARSSLAGLGLVVVELLARLVVGDPYPGATILLLAACALALLPFVPAQLGTPTLRAAIMPTLGLASLSILLTSASIAGVPVTELSVRLAVLAFVVAATLVAALLEPGSAMSWQPRRELAVGLTIAGIVAVAVASSGDIVYPLQVRGTDVGHYLLYAEEVEEQRHLLIDDPFAGEPGRIFADPAAVGAVYGSFLILDGLSSWTLGAGLIVLSAVSVLSVFCAGGALWGVGAGLAAASVYAVAPIRLDPMYWHGVGTTFALVFLPIVVLAIGLMLRGRRDWRTIWLLSLALVGIGAAHSTSAVVVAVFVLLVPVVDLMHRLLRRPVRGVLRSWWREGIVLPILFALLLAAVMGAGVIAHLRAQAVDLGRPVDYRFLGPDWLDGAALSGYYSWQFIGLSAVGLALVLSSSRLRRDSALLSPLALALACVLVNESWRIAFPFEYRRVVYYLAIAMVLVVGLAFLRARPTPIWIAGWVLVVAYLAQLSIGLRLPERLVESRPASPAVTGLREFRTRLDAGRVPDTDLIVSDSCLHFAVPYLLRRPTIPAFGERQVGFENRLPLARKAAAVLEGGPAGLAVARELGVGYVVVDPRCTPTVAERLDGTALIANEELEVVRLSPS
jgi:hypothetical protein